MKLHSTLIVFLLAVLVTAQDKKPEPKKDITAQINEAFAKQRAISRKMREAGTALEKHEDVVALKKAAKDAQDAHQKKLKEALGEVSRTSREASAEYQKILKGLLAKDKDVIATQKELAELKKKEDDLSFESYLTNVKLTHPKSPVVRALDNDPELKKMREEAQGKGIKGWNAYRKAREEKRASLAIAKPLLTKAKELREETDKTRKEIRAAETKLRKAKNQVENGDDEALKAARTKAREARGAYSKAYRSEEIQKLSRAAAQARMAVYKKVQELRKTDKTMTALKKEADEIRATINRLFAERRKKGSK